MHGDYLWFRKPGPEWAIERVSMIDAMPAQTASFATASFAKQMAWTPAANRVIFEGGDVLGGLPCAATHIVDETGSSSDFPSVGACPGYRTLADPKYLFAYDGLHDPKTGSRIGSACANPGYATEDESNWYWFADEKAGKRTLLRLKK